MSKQLIIFASSRLTPGLVKMLVCAAVLLLFISTATHAQQSQPPTSTASVEETFSTFGMALSTKARDLLVRVSQPSGAGEFGIPPSSDERAASALQADRQDIQISQLEKSVERLRALRPVLEPILREEGVPPEFSSVVLVESAAIPTALSPKGARGMWQFMPDTARRYGLTVTTDRDERLDISRSTRAAARYLRELYAQFGDWSLVFAAYNAGEQTVQRAIERSGTTDFSQLDRLLPAETRSYVPAVWASMARLGYNGSAGQLVSSSNCQTRVGGPHRSDSGSAVTASLERPRYGLVPISSLDPGQAHIATQYAQPLLGDGCWRVVIPRRSPPQSVSKTLEVTCGPCPPFPSYHP